MTGRMSNRDRIQRLRAEADATAKEKAAAKAEKAANPAPKRKSSSKTKKAEVQPRGRVRLVWSVCGPNGQEVKQFPYAQEAEARAEAQQMTESSGRTHFVKQSETRVE
jgi:hypothetical protein